MIEVSEHTRGVLRQCAVLLAIVLFSSCSESGSGPQKSAAEFTEDGWAKVTADNYAGARRDFVDAIGKDANYADAYLGAGWMSLYSRDAEGALILFTEGKKHAGASLNVDFLAAIAVAQVETGQYSKCVSNVNSCLLESPDYSFNRIPTVNHLDLKAAKANAYFLWGGDFNLTRAAEVINEIDPSINLDPAVPTTWHVHGTFYPTFSEALLRALEYVGELVEG